MNDKWMTTDNLNKAYQCCLSYPPNCNECPYKHESIETFMDFYCSNIKEGIRNGIR